MRDSFFDISWSQHEMREKRAGETDMQQVESLLPHRALLGHKNAPIGRHSVICVAHAISAEALAQSQ